LVSVKIYQFILNSKSLLT